LDDTSKLESERAQIFGGEDRDLYLHVGYFFTWYNSVEWKITNLMAIVMGESDLSAFDLLVSHLDGRNKVRRFKRLCQIKKQVMEQPFLERLNHFGDKICRLRNRLAHHALARDETNPRFYFMIADRLPWKALGMAAPEPQQSPVPLEAMTLFEHGYWLHRFSFDLGEVLVRAVTRQPLGMDKPRSPLPTPTQTTSDDEGK
jgi:hypothetical protein